MDKTHRSDLVLAALASAAIRGMSPRSVRSVSVSGDFDAAEVTGADGTVVEIRAPQTNRAGAELAAEVDLLGALARLRDAGDLPFDVPRVLGTTNILGTGSVVDGGLAVAQEPVKGTPIDLDNLTDDALAKNLGQAIAAIHALPHSVIENAGMPSYAASEYRDRLMVEFDEIAATGLVPEPLLRRWEEKLEDVSTWRFQPVVSHGDLDAELVLTSGDAVSAITGWANARVADPADDLVWFSVAAPPDAVTTVLDAYLAERGDLVDAGLSDRVQFGSELALARWLRYGTINDLPDVVADATEMLADLVKALGL